MNGEELNVRQLSYFLAIVEHGTMSAASSMLHVAQPSMSLAIRALERGLGTELFHRLGRGLVLSPAGEALVEPARQAMRDLATARASVRAVVDMMAGWLDLMTVPTLAVDPLAELVGAFRARFPHVSVRLHNAEELSVGRAVLEGRSELGVAPLPFEDASLPSHTLGVQELVLVAPASTTLPRSGAGVGFELLRSVPMVVSPEGTSTRVLLEAAFAAIGGQPLIAVEVSPRDAIVPLVLQGAGAALLPRTLAEGAVRRGAVIVQPDPPITRDIGIAHRRGPLSPAAKAFLETAGVSRRGKERAQLLAAGLST